MSDDKGLAWFLLKRYEEDLITDVRLSLIKLLSVSNDTATSVASAIVHGGLSFILGFLPSGVKGIADSEKGSLAPLLANAKARQGLTLLVSAALETFLGTPAASADSVAGVIVGLILAKLTAP